MGQRRRTDGNDKGDTGPDCSPAGDCTFAILQGPGTARSAAQDDELNVVNNQVHYLEEASSGACKLQEKEADN